MARQLSSIITGQLSGKLTLFEPYDFGFYFSGLPEPLDILGRVVFVRNMQVLNNFDGSSGSVRVNPSQQYDISVQKNNVEFGTISIATDGTFTFSTIGLDPIVMSVGDIVTFIAPNLSDLTIDDISASITGELI